MLYTLLLAQQQKEIESFFNNKESSVPIYYNWLVQSKKYLYQGMFNISFVYKKKDASDFIDINVQGQSKEFKLPLNGSHSSIVKVAISPLDQENMALLIYYFSGSTSGLQGYMGIVRLYMVVLQEHRIGPLFKGPVVWHEIDQSRVSVREREVKFVDLNGDGTKEIVVQSALIKRAYCLSKNKLIYQWCRP